MNTRSLIATLSVCATALAISVVMSNAGPLSPPAGPVAPTNKTLAEVEPRVAVNATNTPGDADSLFKISQPGSYYLTGNITGVADKHGVEIAVGGVTLDLNGFELAGVVDSLDGVRVSAAGDNVKIHNGAIRDWGGDGVDARFASNSLLSDLRASNNGVDGLRVGATSVVEACSARFNGATGITASSGSTITACAAQSNGGDGIIAGITSTITTCTAAFNGGDGIFTNFGSTIRGNTASINTGDGVQAGADSLVVGNACNSNGFNGDGAGIHITSSDTRVEGNTVTDNDRGIDVDDSGNIIIRNSASGNTTNYSIVAGNSVGQIFSVAGATITTSNSWANFSF